MSFCCGKTWCVLLIAAKTLVFHWLLLGSAAGAAEIRVEDFGARGDGASDDGPAIERAVKALRAQAGPATLRFQKARTYRVKTSPTTWVFTLEGLRDVTLDGNGSSFVLDPALRLVHLTGCTNVTVRGMSLDFDPLPFADGTVVGADPAARSVDVRIHDGFAVPPLGGPTREKEQAYFAMLWHPGPHGLTGQHYFIDDVREARPGSVKQRVVRAVAAPGFRGFDRIRAGQTQISLPVRGVAHKVRGHGASPAVLIHENDGVCFEDVEIWSAPLFAVSVARNRGACAFRRFHIRPKPGTTRLTSSWRDGFHVKGNSARLLWEDCRLDGMNDDAFNIATHSSRVVEVLSETRLRVRQNFPLGFIPFSIGDTLAGYSVVSGRLLGRAKIAGAAPEAAVDPADPDRPAPPLRVTLAGALLGVTKGDLVWNESSANPHTTLRRCRIFNSCRFQSPVTIDDCDVGAFCWFYGDNVEGPLPRNVVIRNSRFQLGRGNREMVAAFTSLIHGPDGKRALPREPVIANLCLEDNTFDGLLDVGFAENVALSGNHFLLPGGRLAIHDSRSILLEDNAVGESPLERLEQITVPDEPTRRAVTIRHAAKAPIRAEGRFVQLTGWGGGKPEEIVPQAAEVGFDEIIVGSRDAQLGQFVAVGRKHNIGIYSSITLADARDWKKRRPGVPPPLQEMNAEENAALERIRTDQTLGKSGYQYGGEPVQGIEVLQTPLLCFHHAEVRPFFEEQIRDLLRTAGLCGIAMDFFGYQNYRCCRCPTSMKAFEAWHRQHPDVPHDKALDRFSLETLVDFVNDLARCARSVRADAKVTCHVYPVFLPEPLYGNRLDVDFCGQTAAWYFEPLWSYEKIRAYTRVICGEEKKHFARPEGVAMIGVYTRPALYPVKSPERLTKELQAILDGGGDRVQVCSLNDVLKDPATREVFRRTFRRAASANSDGARRP